MMLWLNRLLLETVWEGGPFRKTEQEEEQVNVGEVWLGHADTFFTHSSTQLLLIK